MRFTLAGVFLLSLLAQGQSSPLLLHRVDGFAAGDDFGFTVDGVGDVDGDGFDDFASASFRHMNDFGLAVIYSGATGQILWSSIGEVQGDRYGIGVGAAGDVNGDNIGDFWVSAHRHSTGGFRAGRVYIYSGITYQLIHVLDGEAAQSGFGTGFTALNDMDGDGADEFVVAARWHDVAGLDAGRIYLYSGATATLIRSQDGEAAGDEFGTSIDNAGDVDGDSCDDLVVGALGHDTGGNNAGRAYLISGASGQVLFTFDGEAGGHPVGDEMGASSSGAGDIDLDGTPDIVVGAQEHDMNGPISGRAYVFSGATGMEIYHWDGEFADDQFGDAVDGVGDINSDNIPDVIVGAHRFDAGGNNTGKLYAFSGADGSLLWTVIGEVSGDNFADAAKKAGDVNGDGKPDIICGGHFNSGVGRAYVFSDPSAATGPRLDLHAGGFVALGQGGPHDLLFAGGSAGGAERRVDVPLFGTTILSVAQPVGNPSPAAFVVFLELGVPSFGARYPLAPLGDASIRLCPLFPSNSGLAIVASSFGPIPPCDTLFPASTAPWTSPPLQAPGVPVNATVQLLIEESPLVPAIANALILDIR